MAKSKNGGNGDDEFAPKENKATDATEKDVKDAQTGKSTGDPALDELMKLFKGVTDD